MSVRGGDAAGDAVAQAIAAAGIEDLSAVFLDRAHAELYGADRPPTAS